MSSEPTRLWALLSQGHDLVALPEQLADDVEGMLGHEGLADHRRVAERSRQSLPSISGEECKGDMKAGQGCRQLIDRPAAEIGVKEGGLDTGGRDEAFRLRDTRCRSHD